MKGKTKFNDQYEEPMRFPREDHIEGFSKNEQRMYIGLIRSGVDIVPGKRYTYDEVVKMCRDSAKGSRVLSNQACGALLKGPDGEIMDEPMLSLETYATTARRAEARIRDLIKDDSDVKWAYGLSDGGLDGGADPDYSSKLEEEAEAYALRIERGTAGMGQNDINDQMWLFD